MTTDPGARLPASPLVRAGWIGMGLTSVGIGGVGVVVPGLPSTVFFIVAAWAFARSSPRLEAWILDLPTVGQLVRDHRAGLGMPRRAKATAAVMMTVFVSLSVWLLDGWVLRSAIAATGLAGLWVVLFRVPTKPADPPRRAPG